ncbi:MAG: hypothetical protein U0736_00795 [Gemmataceae bacterium]
MILEDLDLIGEDGGQRARCCCRTCSARWTDWGRKAELVFLLTTNRPGVLEPAACRRRGGSTRRSLPLPDEACRRRLFALYGKGLNLAAVELSALDSVAEELAGVHRGSCCRRAALLAAERGETADPLPITDDDLAQAMNELVCFGGELTQKLLGFKPFGFTRGN